MGEMLLEIPAGKAAKKYLLHLCKQADQACSRLGNTDDTEALHDFRVAIRRSRSWVRAYHHYLPIDKPLQKRLRSLAKRTNAARDAEVSITELQAFADVLNTSQKIGLRWLLTRFTEHKQQSYTDILQHVPHAWPPVSKELRHHLRRRDGKDSASFSKVAFELAALAQADLVQKLETVGGLQDIEAIHKSRIAAKRLRYLLEPFREEVPEIREAVENITALQDAMGELHDGYVLELKLATAVEDTAASRARRLLELALKDTVNAQRAVRVRNAEQPGLFALAKLVTTQQHQRFTDMQAQYLGFHMQHFLGDLEIRISHLND